jgi:hypothetical protein
MYHALGLLARIAPDWLAEICRSQTRFSYFASLAL